MELSKLISTRMSGGKFNLYNRDGVHIASDVATKEYTSIRNHLLANTRPGETVAIKATKDYRYFFGMIACLESGIPYVPMMADYPSDRVEQIREDAGFKLILTDDLLDRYAKEEIPSQTVRESSPDAPAYIIFTSGSTGRPKGVIIPRKALANFIEWEGQEFTQLGASDHLLQVTEFTFDISLTDLALFLLHGPHLHFSSFKGDIYKLAYELETYGITALSTVPNNLSMLLADEVVERINIQTLKSFLICGARFSHGLYEKCRKRLSTDVHVYNLYGPTESTVYSHVKKLSFKEALDCDKMNVSIGVPLLNVTCCVVKDGKVLGPREEGELLLGGIQLMEGYIKDPERTAKAIVQVGGERFYRTGDISFVDERGEYYIIGRLDDTLKSRGFRINLLDIDSYIQRLPYVEDCATVAIPHEISENQIIAFLKIRENKTAKEVKNDLAELIPSYQIPEKVIFVDKYPTNTSGKICKKTLKEEYLNNTKR